MATVKILPEAKGKQREVLALPGLGHHVVLGTAGSGKTVMAIHRSARLSNPVSSTAGKVLQILVVLGVTGRIYKFAARRRG
jgi:hypothetical protein